MRAFAAGLLLGMSVIIPAQASSPPSNMVVLELFTSQGCSSCPPADALLQQLANDPQILALSFHVDYWDNSSWRDPFSRPESTARQYAYGKALGQNGVYTPELVIDGARGMVGSRRSDIQAAVAAAKTQDKPVSVSTTPSEDGMSINLSSAAPVPKADIWLVTYSPQAVTAVRGGENSGHDLVSINNVKFITKIGQLTGTSTQLNVPALIADNHYAVLVQVAENGKIIGAGKT